MFDNADRPVAPKSAAPVAPKQLRPVHFARRIVAWLAHGIPHNLNRSSLSHSCVIAEQRGSKKFWKSANRTKDYGTEYIWGWSADESKVKAPTGLIDPFFTSIDSNCDE